MTEWQDYAVFRGNPVAANTLLMLDTADTPPTAGNVKQILLPAALQMLLPSGDTSGADDAAAIGAALTALSGAPGVIRLSPQAPWYIACATVGTLTSGQYIDATGCVINATGAGDLFNFTDTSTPDTRPVHGAGILGYPVIDGTATTGNSSAVHAGDIFQLALFLQAQNFAAGTTSKGAWLDNRHFWTEQAYGRILASGCTAGVVLDVSAGNTTNTGSFERCHLYCAVDQDTATFDGVVIQNGAFIQDGILTIVGNFVTSASPLTSAVLRVNGQTPSGTAEVDQSSIGNSVLNIGAELDTTTGSDAPYTVFFGTTSNFIINCTGSIDFGAAGAFQSSNNAGQVANYQGIIAGDPNLPATPPSGITNIADSPQTVSAVIGSPVAVANLTLPVAAFTAYRIRLYIPYSSTHAAGTPTFIFTGPSFALASLDWWYQTAATPWTAAKTISTSAPLMTGPTLSTGANLALLADGVIALSSAGDLGISAYTSNVTDTFIVAIGAYLELLPLAAP